MPTIAEVFYPSTVDDDGSYGTTVKKLIEVNPGNNTATTATWTSTTAAIRTLIPLAGSTAATDTSSSNGWAFNNGGADGLGSVTGALRRIRAGVWTFRGDFILNTPALLATISCAVTARVYRVSAAGVRTLLFTAVSANFSASTVGLSWDSTSQPEILLGDSEVIMVGYTAVSAATAALVLGAVTNTVLTLRTSTNTSIDVPAPGIETIANTNGSSAGAGAADGVLAGFGAMAASSAGAATASGEAAATGAMAGSSDGTSSASGALAAVAPTAGNSAGTSDANGAQAAVGAMVGLSEGFAAVAGAAAIVLPTAGSSTGAADAAGALAGVGAMAGNSAGIATATGSMGAVAETAGSSQGSSSAIGSLAAVAPTVGTVNVAEGGGGSIEYPRGLLRLNEDGVLEELPGGSGSIPAGVLAITEYTPP